MNNTPRRVLVAENNNLVRDLIEEILRQDGHTVVTASNGGEALERFRNLGPFDAAFLGLNLAIIDGTIISSNIRKESPTTAVVIVVGADRNGLLTHCIRDEIMNKPFDAAKPPEIMQRAIEIRHRAIAQ